MSERAAFRQKRVYSICARFFSGEGNRPDDGGVGSTESPESPLCGHPPTHPPTVQASQPGIPGWSPELQARAASSAPAGRACWLERSLPAPDRASLRARASVSCMRVSSALRQGWHLLACVTSSAMMLSRYMPGPVRPSAMQILHTREFVHIVSRVIALPVLKPSSWYICGSREREKLFSCGRLDLSGAQPP